MDKLPNRTEELPKLGFLLNRKLETFERDQKGKLPKFLEDVLHQAAEKDETIGNYSDNPEKGISSRSIFVVGELYRNFINPTLYNTTQMKPEKFENIKKVYSAKERLRERLAFVKNMLQQELYVGLMTELGLNKEEIIDGFKRFVDLAELIEE